MSVYGYDENLNYDKMGNVNFLQRKTSSTLRDYLGFSYIGNQISSVYDYVGQINVYDIKEYNNNNTSGYDFQYDPNGNMTVDKDRKIVAIKYNLLNLPDVIQFSNGNQIKNRYAADGRKLGTEYFTQLTTIQPLAEGTILNQVYQANVVDQTGTAYVGNYEYKTYWNVPYYITLKKVFNSEGYVDEYSNNQSYSGYVYFRKDHLGNNREVWRAGKPGGASATTLQRTWYYPSGLPWNYTLGLGAGIQPYKYNSKEFIEMHGFDTYDYSARMMYPAVGGRFMTIDPMAEKYYSISPYVYCGNNPISRVDPDGCDWYQFENKNGTKSTVWQEGDAKTVTLNDQVYNNIGTTYLAKYDWGDISYNQNNIADVYPYMSTSDLSISDKGLSFLIDREGLKLKPYNDSKGFSTVGVGHLIEKRAVTEQDKKDWAWFDTKQEAMDLLQTDLSGTYEKAVKSLVDVPLMQFQYDAIVSFTFNVGVGGLKKSNFLKELNGGYYNGRLMLNYRRPSDIIPRRKKEVNLFNNATY